MHYTLHLTNDCNLSCIYCGLKKAHEYMNRSTAYRAVDLALADPDSTIGIGFFGGEPLLCKDLIIDIVAYANEHNTTGKKLFFKLTTNGLLLDDPFLLFAQKEKILISLSLDGNKEAHDTNRKTCTGLGSYDNLLSAADKLLRLNPHTAAMMTVAPNTVPFFSESVQSLYSLGFINIVCTLDYSANWTEKDLTILKKQYKKLAGIYYKQTASEKNFFFSPFDSKIDSHVNNKEYCAERCKLGFEQISVDKDGALYPCVQFAGNPAYQIGDVSSGIEQTRRQELYVLSRTEQPQCQVCVLKNRCLHTCACLNKYTTGKINEPSPILCAVERLLIPVADSVAARLYKKRNTMFIQKHYNEFYPLVSMLENCQLKKKLEGVRG